MNDPEPNLNAIARDFLNARGLDPADLPDPTPFDPTKHLREHAELMLSAGLPRRFHAATADHPEILDWIGEATADLAAAPTLLLLGPTGTGKTHQAIGALRAIVTGRANLRRPITWRSTTHPTFNADMRPRYDDAHIRALDDATACDLLAFDDLGAGKASEWTGDTLHRLVDARWADCRPVIATTNLTPPELRKAIGDRVASRLSSGLVVVVTGRDRRQDPRP